MRILVALDSFKGSLSAREACHIVSGVLRDHNTDWCIESVPLADGGEGTVEALVSACNGQFHRVSSVTGPLAGMRVDAVYGWLPSTRTAVIEMASASGLPLLAETERDPLRTTTMGTGELIADAIERGASDILLTLGGSATVDGGTGAASALGWRFLDASGRPLSPGGGDLVRLAKIRSPERASFPRVDALCDVDNPLYGPRGAAAVYGPQKGATPAMVSQLERALKHLAAVTADALGLDVGCLPGAGAAGGFGAGAVAFLGARLRPGFEAVAETVGLADRLRGCDWVVTGEGRLDDQSLQGKVVSGVCRAAAQVGTRVAVLAGIVALDGSQLERAGITRAFQTKPSGMDASAAMRQARTTLAAGARRLASVLE